MLKKYESMKEYNGVVDVEGTKVKVVDGIATVDGDQYFVSKDGAFVIDSERRLLGTVRNGKFFPVDDEVIARLKEIGGIEEGE